MALDDEGNWTEDVMPEPTMPDPLDTLRKHLAAMMGSHLLADPPKRGVSGNSMADEVMRFLADAAKDPARLRAILDLIGLEVRTAWLCDRSGQGSNRICMVEHRCFCEDPDPVEVLVCRVRPQGEQANA